MKQNKKYLAIIIAIIVLASNLAITGIAYTDNLVNNVDFSNQPIVKNHTGNEFLDGTHLFNTYVTSDHSQETYYYAYTEQDKEYYAFLAGSSSYTLYVVGQVSGIAYLSISSNNIVAQNVTLDCRQIIDNNTGLYGSSRSIGSPISAYTYESDIPIFNSESDGYAAVLDWIDNPPAPSETPHTLSYDLAPGYVAFIDIHGLSNIGGSVNTSSAVALAPSDFIATNQLYGYTNSIPSSFNLPLNGSMSYSWNASKLNVWGKSQQWFWTGTYSGGSNYLFIANPTYSNLFGQQSNGTSMVLDNPSATNSYIHIFLRECYSIKIVSLKAEYSYDPALGSYGAIDNGSGDTIVDGTYDETTGQWQYVNQTTGEAVGSELPVGGENDIQTPTSSDSIIGWLQTISNQISGFFNGAVGAISTLVQAGSSFFRVLTGLYSWLPVSVLSVLTSALVLIITIGFIKVFL